MKKKEKYIAKKEKQQRKKVRFYRHFLTSPVPAPIPRRHPDFADTYQHKVLANT
jgi:hypothetical protein